MASSDLKDFVTQGLRRHPRVLYQRLLEDDGAASALAASLPTLTPFARPGARGTPTYRGGIAILDWDHRLPSLGLVLRLYGYYTKSSLLAGEGAYDDRLALIESRDRYPEFDVPDFADLTADESYEVELDTLGGVGECRLTSTWRRRIARKDASKAETTVRNSDVFRELDEKTAARPPQLGGAEAVSWTPPCESGHPRWTIDVWYLLSFDGRVAAGQSFLVDVHDEEVVRSREITVRAG